jgi:hypothetical protein
LNGREKSGGRTPKRSACVPYFNAKTTFSQERYNILSGGAEKAKKIKKLKIAI